MKRTTRIILIIICTLLIILSAVGVIWAFVNKFSNKAYADYLDVVNDQNAIVNFNQYYSGAQPLSINGTYSTNTSIYNQALFTCNSNDIFYCYNNYEDSATLNFYLVCYNNGTFVRSIVCNNNVVSVGAGVNQVSIQIFVNSGTINGNYYFNCINLTQMYGTNNTPTLEQCQEIFKSNYYNYTTGTAISVNGFDQYNNGAMSVRESMTINTTSANIADNLDNVVINSSYGSTSKALIQGFMVWNTEDNYTNCTALFNLQTNFNEGDYFEFEFYTITGADTLNLPNQSFTMDLQIIAVDSSGSIVPLTTIKAQNNTTTPTKATFYLPFDTDKLYITTPHKYIVGYNNFNINITTTNLTALSLYSYQDGYRSGRSNGYTAGYNKGLSETNATLGTMEYIGSAFAGIGQILQIELLPGVPFSLFILLPLMFGLIAFVVKLSKGGS